MECRFYGRINTKYIMNNHTFIYINIFTQHLHTHTHTHTFQIHRIIDYPYQKIEIKINLKFTKNRLNHMHKIKTIK